MSADEVRKMLDAYLSALGERGDYARFFTDDIRFDVVGTDTTASGREDVEQAIRFLHEIAFDAHPEVLLVLADEDHAAAEFVFAGTHTGDFGGVQPTGNSVRVPYSAVYDVADGRISAIRVYLSIELLVAQAQGQGKSVAEQPV